MAVIKTDGNFMGLPMNIARGNPIPLDKSEIWYSYAEMEAYAKNNPVAYVGQMLGLIDEETQTSAAYIILNTAGDLQKIGSSTIGADGQSLTIKDETISLNNWGVKYYKFIPAKDNQPAHYVLQEVDEDHPWIAGLEPRVSEENGQMILAWYEPNQSTIEGINSSLSVLQTSLEDLKINTYTKKEVDVKIAEAGHLQRIIVDSIDDIDVNANDADRYIYMILTSPENTSNKYDEYMVMIFHDYSGEETRYLEKVGSWEVDLSNYVTSNTFNVALSQKVDVKEGYGLISQVDLSKLANIEVGAQVNFINAVNPDNFEVVDKQLNLKAISVDQVVNLAELLDGKVDKEEGKGLSSNDFTDEFVQAIQVNTQNISTLSGKVSSIEEILNGSENSVGLAKAVEAVDIKVENLNDIVDQQIVDLGAVREAVEIHGTAIETLDSTVDRLSTQINGINLGSYISKEVFQSTVGDLRELMAGEKTLHEQVKDVQAALTWGDLDTDFS